ncbi:hypothetical protein LR48_Vigan50s008700 [Vigna angularis]|uniref:Myb/SANT-like domain-containing protein n=1 Tax=Phaseolus angularis TaxID=3914 RepID=A0A0L9T3L8_PHAAN|nr:hypothetical protein LR48_Vigan50s008700 [Vigna angularis]
MKTSAGSVEETKNTLVDEEDECAKVENEDQFQQIQAKWYPVTVMRIRIPDGYLVGLHPVTHPVTHPVFVPYMSTSLVHCWQCLAWRIVGECRRCSSHATKKLVAKRSVSSEGCCRISWSFNQRQIFRIGEGCTEVGGTDLVRKVKNKVEHSIASSCVVGFAWNAVIMRFEAEDEVWADLIQSRPTATKWRVNSIRHYDLMVDLWAADRATGSGVWTARQARRQRVGPRVQVDLNQNMDYIPEEPNYHEYRDPTPPSPPPSVDEYSPGQTQSVPFVPSGGTSSSRGSKRKAPMVDAIDSQFDKLKTSLDGFTDVLGSTNVHFGVISDAAVRQVSAMEDRNQILRRTSTYTYTESDIYEMLSAMNIFDETLLDQCYDFLCSNPTCTKRLMGLPPHKRWNKLCKMIAGGQC